MAAKIFLSTVSDEFRAYRDQLRSELTRHNVEVKVQEDFKDLGAPRPAGLETAPATPRRPGQANSRGPRRSRSAPAPPRREIGPGRPPCVGRSRNRSG